MFQEQVWRAYPSSRAKVVNTGRGPRLVVCNKEVPPNMLQALRAVLLGRYSINRAALEFRVSQSTLWRYVGMLQDAEFRQFIALTT